MALWRGGGWLLRFWYCRSVLLQHTCGGGGFRWQKLESVHAHAKYFEHTVDRRLMGSEEDVGEGLWPNLWRRSWGMDLVRLKPAWIFQWYEWAISEFGPPIQSNLKSWPMLTISWEIWSCNHLPKLLPNSWPIETMWDNKYLLFF